MLRARLIYYLRKVLTKQPLAVAGSGGGGGSGDALPHFLIIF